MLPAFTRSCCFVLLAGCVAGLSPCSADEIVSPRKPWTTNKVSGSPEPPPPLKTVVRFPDLKLDQPLLIESDPAGQRLWVASQNGSVHSFLDDREVSEPDLFVDLREVFDQLTPHPTAKRVGAAYGLVHHPEYPRVPVCWIAYTLAGAPEGALDDGTRVSRFNVTFDADGIPRCDVASEKVVLTFREGGHNGACLKFGPDGCLYISTGDSEVPNPPDPLRTGQDVTNLLSAILRIDVNATGEEPLYWIPADNPFVVTELNPGSALSRTPASATATLTAATADPQSRRRHRRQLRRREEQSAKDTTDDAADSTTAEGDDSSEAKPTTTLSGLPISYERSLPDSLRHPQEASWAEFSKTVDTFPAEKIRPEIFAYGFRNPWKMNFGPDGQLWVGDVGWEMYEMVYNVKRGGNYGWSVMEGPQQVLPNQRRGPTPILPAAVAYSHAEGASVTGGFVYRGKKFPELVGKYIFGDWETRRIWASDITPSDDGQADILTNLVDLVDLRLRIVAFGEDADGELIISNFYEGLLYELERNDAAGRPTAFPKTLSETGLFADTSAQNPAPGVLPFDVNAPMWNDGAAAQRWVGVPGDGVIEVLKSPQQKDDSSLRERMRFPTDSVLARTVTLPDDTGRPVNLETQMLHYDGLNWYGYSYVWNPEQTDATLAPASGTELNLAEYGRFSQRSSWPVHSRSECLRCHNLWIGGALAFTLPQLSVRRDSDPVETSATGSESRRTETSQLEHFRDVGLLTGALPDDLQSTDDARLLALANPYDEHADLADRARSYLSINCSHCHQNGAGGTATIDLRFEASVEEMKSIAAPPAQGLFQIDGGAIIVPGQPSKSVLLYRTACSGRGRMPHIGSTEVDAAGVRLLRNWIASLDGDSHDSGEASQPPAHIADALKSTEAALRVVAMLDDNRLEGDKKAELLTAAREAVPEIRNLFVRFQPAEYRRTLNRTPDAATILATSGDATRGAALFADKSRQCITCHKIGSEGGQIGPALDDVGKRLKREEILESLLEPSKKIDPKYAAWTVITTAGKVHAGLLVERTESHVVLRTAMNEDIRIARDDVEDLIQQTVSLMPDRQLNDLPDQQIADLLEFLATQKTTR